MKTNVGFTKLGDIFAKKSAPIKPPAHEWQELALRVIKDINAPSFKRNSVFKICKDYPKSVVEACLNDTKELCKTGEKWKYFFKVIDSCGSGKAKPSS